VWACILGPLISIGQVSMTQLTLKPGKYDVGFTHYVAFDSSRTYNRTFDWNGKYIPRPIPISIWYPSVQSAEQGLMSILDYLVILKEEEEWEYLPNEQILNWFYYQNNQENQLRLEEKTQAHKDAEPLLGQFPAIIYAPSYQASSIENFALFEFLASHGFVITSSPSRGHETRFLKGGIVEDMETQARDIEFLIQKISGKPYVDTKKIASMGFSFGGLSNVLAQMRNDNIRAIVSLDGSVKYQYEKLKKSAFYSIEQMDVPFIHFSQKNIPDSVLKEDKIDPKLDYRFEFYNNLINSEAYSFKFHDLTHSYFSSLGVLFEKRDPRQDKSDIEIKESYKLMCTYTLNFLNAFLNEDAKSKTYLDNDPLENGISAGLVSKKSKLPANRSFTFEEFNVVASTRKYKNLNELYDSIKSAHPTFKLEEWKLNNLGLQLTFNPQTSSHGISVLVFATEIHSDSANLLDSLAEAYLFVGNKKMASDKFKESLQLNYQNQNAINRLKELESAK